MINLGDKVKDTISGFIGIAIAKHSYLYGCTRISVQPPVKEGKLAESEAFDEPQLFIISKTVIKEGNKDVGGPAFIPSTKRSTGRRKNA